MGIDEVGVDKVGIDRVGIDEVGINKVVVDKVGMRMSQGGCELTHFIVQHTLEPKLP